MSAQGFGGTKSRAAPPASAAPSADAEFKALLRAAKEEADAGAEKKKRRPEGAASMSKPLPKIKFGRMFYFYLAAAVVWGLGLLWLSMLNASPNFLQLALTQVPVAGIVVAAHWPKKKA